MYNPNSNQPGRELEYKALRDEILKRIELRQQLMSTTLLFAGALLGVAANNLTRFASVAFIYPPIAFSLAALWAQNDIRSRELGMYIHRLENNHAIPGLGWETHYRANLRSPRLLRLKLSVLSPAATFIVSEIIAVIIALSSWASFSIFLNIALQISNIIWILGTIALVWKVARFSSQARL
ncbi:MAG: hypothetical protein HC929_09235 [Leptolyngbyaceae cyanobacterium SM2_5_2]|nr:hypothetical protein [Leptolyngbyaceae cyanobacterium SM2_5_2]